MLGLARLEDALVAKLAVAVPAALARYAAVAGTPAETLPVPVSYTAGPPPMTSVAYPALFVNVIEVRGTRPGEEPGYVRSTYRVEVLGYVRGETREATYDAVRILETVIRSTLVASGPVAAGIYVNPATVRTRTAVEPVSGRSLAALSVEVDLDADEALLLRAPRAGSGVAVRSTPL